MLNVYLHRLLHSSTTQYIDESSVHRAIALLSSPGPRDVNSTLTFLSDTSDKQYPIFRNGGKPDYVITVATGKLESLISCVFTI